MELSNFVSLLGLIAFILIGYLFSTDRKAVNWHVVIWGIGIQFLFAWFLFIFPAGVKLFLFLNDVVVKILDSACAGANFVFGPLAAPPGKAGSIGFILAFQAFPTIIFFSSLMTEMEATLSCPLSLMI